MNEKLGGLLMNEKLGGLLMNERLEFKISFAYTFGLA